jgi:2-polyprenyl-6-methoxyphenol hydroxylase-like FAD-dependent oxidoreductase
LTRSHLAGRKISHRTGGLSAAIALRNAGHDVTVYEKYASAFTSTTLPLSNAISTGANILRIIDKWGFDFEKAKGGLALQERIFHGETMQQMHRIDFKYNREDFGYDWLLMRRQALHEGLLDIVTATSEEMIPIKVRLGREVSAIDCEAGKVTLEDSEETLSDLVVVADGANSKLIHTITNDTTPPLRGGRTAYRFMVTREQIMADPALRAVYENEEEGFTYYLLSRHTVRRGPFILLSACTSSGSNKRGCDWEVVRRRLESGIEEVDRDFPPGSSKVVRAGSHAFAVDDLLSRSVSIVCQGQSSRNWRCLPPSSTSSRTGCVCSDRRRGLPWIFPLRAYCDSQCANSSQAVGIFQVAQSQGNPIHDNQLPIISRSNGA